MAVDPKHPNFPAPAADTTIWRYSSLPKLLSLLVTKELFLPSLRNLRRDDPFEGTPTLQNRRLAAALSSDEAFAEQFFQTHYPDIQGKLLVNFKLSIISSLDGTNLSLADTCFVNCWHARRQESAALWKLYAETQAGVAIKSSVATLCEAIETDKDTILGAVRYCDFENTYTDMGNALTAVFTKRDSYEHEHEVRLLLWDMDVKGASSGKTISCNPSKMIEEIVVSPYSDDWMVATVAEVVRRMGFEFPVRKSRLMNPSLD
ncbi:DUF2971 domain-containing protein [Mesorhizobium sp.]|uniref:DUF2971 domain-containing protein n=1 Tax=Mesorhizobium sp. TaxID=1871066 RepID=UPI000FE6F702|nr:DUF2971 domain-containing protein [Mesorhizobium sp.]RWP06447.1 MAG: DUF2971 domain-containing protein [Mesorhizobium sp.]